MNIKDVAITSLKTKDGFLKVVLGDGTQWDCPLSLAAAALADIGPSGQKAIKITFPVVEVKPDVHEALS